MRNPILFNLANELFRSLDTAPAISSNRSIGIEVTENDKEYIVHGVLPGVNKEDIKIDFENDVLTISAKTERKSQTENSDHKVIRSERYYGEMTRSISFNKGIDFENANAAYKDGILELTLPKMNGGGRKNLEIK